MIFKGEDKIARVLINTCNCGCGSELHICQYKYEEVVEPEYNISLHSSKFDEEQLGIFSILLRRLKRAWFCLRGKDYLYMDIVMSKEEFNDFIVKCKSLQE